MLLERKSGSKRVLDAPPASNGKERVERVRRKCQPLKRRTHSASASPSTFPLDFFGGFQSPRLNAVTLSLPLGSRCLLLPPSVTLPHSRAVPLSPFLSSHTDM